jgi:uncharacterized protein (TIGR02722 family)
MKKIFYVLIAVVFVFSCVGCATNGVQRIDPNKQTDLSGYWNDTDVRIIAETLVEECVNAPAIIRYIKENQKEPVIQLGSFKNRSDEHLDTAILATKFKVALINSGKVKFSAEKEIKEELREEILAQQDWASEETVKNLANETGADFLLIGSVRTIVDSIPGETVRTYQVIAELYDIETSEIVWSGENMDIKKYMKRSSVRW